MGDAKATAKGEANNNGVSGEAGVKVKALGFDAKARAGSMENNVTVGLNTEAGSAEAKVAGSITTEGVSAKAEAGAHMQVKLKEQLV